MGNIFSAHRDGPVVLVSQEIKYTFPFSYAYLAGYLRQQGEDVRVVFRPSWGGPQEFIKKVMALQPLLLGLGSLYPEMKVVEELIAGFNAAGRRFPIVVGGQMVSPIPEFAVQRTGADIGVIGEGEIPLFRLARLLREGKDIGSVGGLAIRDQGRVTFTGPGDYIEDLSQLPPIPYELFPEEKWVPVGRYYTDRAQPHWRFNDRVIPVHGGRGCPFTCNFCYHHSKFRYRAIPDMIAEAKVGLERFNGNMLYFGDDLVIFNAQRAKQLTQAIGALAKPVEYSISARFDVLERIDDITLQAMKKTGCRIMGLGIESGSQRILDLMDKRITVKQIREGLARLKAVGILPTVSMMVGQVSETREDVKASTKLMLEALKNNPAIEFAFTVVTPFPGSPLYSLALEKGMLKSHKDFYDRYDFKSRGRSFQLIVDFSELPHGEAIAAHALLGRLYKKNKRALLGLKIALIEGLRAMLHRGHLVYTIFLAQHLPPWMRDSSCFRGCRRLYDAIQQSLDTLRLRWYGV